MSCLFLMTASGTRACACDTAARLCVRTVLCSSAFSSAPPLRSHELRRSRGRFVRSLLCYFGQVRLLRRAHRRLQPPAFPTTSRPRLAGAAMEISRFPCKRLLRMPGSTTTRGRRVSCDIDTSRVAFCGTENISTPNLSYAAQYLACALPFVRFTFVLADNPRITRGQCGSLLLHRDGLPPSTSCRFPGAPVHSIRSRHPVASL